MDFFRQTKLEKNLVQVGIVPAAYPKKAKIPRRSESLSAITKGHKRSSSISSAEAITPVNIQPRLSEETLLMMQDIFKSENPNTILKSSANLSNLSLDLLVYSKSINDQPKKVSFRTPIASISEFSTSDDSDEESYASDEESWLDSPDILLTPKGMLSPPPEEDEESVESEDEEWDTSLPLSPVSKESSIEENKGLPLWRPLSPELNHKASPERGRSSPDVYRPLSPLPQFRPISPTPSQEDELKPFNTREMPDISRMIPDRTISIAKSPTLRKLREQNLI
ncbi:hypothetical protein HK103_003232 [Boothiomyces macroporosus]|uniref:Uncharacterized protein n=1 Tax=Boothiomyces macroporosus TaxID=261099 RepID=A0AAD5UJ22_9FUNG|nr:hypothetical protein HK103_003232 [Boothiomyces macroporosus]